MEEASLTTSQVAQRLGIGTKTLLRAVRRGDVRPALRTPGGHLRFRSAEVDAYAQRRARRRATRVAAGGAPAAPVPTIAAMTTVLGKAALAMDRLIHLQTVTAALSQALTPADVAEVVVHQGIAAFGASAGSIELLTSDGQELETVAAIGYPPDTVAPYRRLPLLAAAPLADAVRGGQSIWLETLDAWRTRYGWEPLAHMRHGLFAAAAVPLEAAGCVLGAVGLSFAEERTFDADDRSFFHALAHQCAQALERARLFAAELAAREAAELAEARFRAQYRGLPVPTFTYQRRGDDWIFVDCNAAAETATRGTVHAFLGKNAHALFGQRPELLAEFACCVDGQTTIRREAPWQRLSTGEQEEMIFTFVFVPPDLVMVHTEDVTQRKRMEDALRHQALHDALTGLPNRVLLSARVEQAIQGAERAGAPAALLLLDLDRFKEINDAFGHQQGDLVLQQVARRLVHSLRAKDTVARLGGDEFAVLLPDETHAGALTVADKIGAALAAPVTVQSQAFPIGASIGIALYPEHGRDMDMLLRRADVAMYTAKRGQGISAVYAPEQDQHTPERLALIAELRAAIAQGELQLHYQPKMHLATRRIHGVEALIRWPHPRTGQLQPDLFIPLAEEAGLMVALTHWVLEAAIRQCRVWQQAGLALCVAVNLSTTNLYDIQLPAAIARILTAHEVPAAALRVEVTESTLMADMLRAGDVLNHLAALGVGISVDDYGTGYSSLAYLKSLPVDELKIDMSFVQHMTEDAADAAIVASTIGLGHTLGLRVVAEGIESEDAWTMLREWGCDEAQGFYLTRPLPPEALEEWLRLTE